MEGVTIGNKRKTHLAENSREEKVWRGRRT